jgi:hypothetical protein
MNRQAAEGRFTSPGAQRQLQPDEPEGTPSAMDRAIDRTLAVWQPRCVRPLSREDARQIRENMLGAFRVLLEWDARAQKKRSA